MVYHNTTVLSNYHGLSDSDGIQGGGEDRNEAYGLYGERGPEPVTQKTAESGGPQVER